MINHTKGNAFGSVWDREITLENYKDMYERFIEIANDKV